MSETLINIHWEKIDEYSDEDITYFLFLEGKSKETITKIRGLDLDTVQKHILNGKIKYGILGKSSNEEEFFNAIVKAAKLDKLDALNSLDSNTKEKLVKYIRANYTDMYTKSKETAVWILGELKESSSIDIIKKATVHNHVNVRRMAVSALGKIENEECEDILIRALNDVNPQVVQYAIKALDKIESKKAFEKIKKLYEITEKEYIKIAAEKYMQKIGSE